MSTRRVNRTRLQKGVKSTTKQRREEKPTDLIYQRMHRLRKVLNAWRQTESEGLQKLFVAYYVATKGRPLSDFESLIELEKLHGVSFHGTKYENRNACRDFVLSISDYLFQVDVKEKVSRANFIAILTDGTTDATITEQEVIYLLYLDPDNFVPRLSFFTVSELHQGQDAAMLKSAIVNAFTENNMEDALTKIVFFGSDGTWTNSGLKSGLITRLKEDFEWILFVWCLSHRLELAMKDSLKTFMSPVDDSLRHLYYMYKNSSKKLSQLKTLFKSLTEIYEYETKAIKPEKSTGTRWLDHKIKGMEKLTDKFGVYAAQIKNSIDARNCTAADRAVLQGKLNALTQVSVILRSALLTDILEPAKKNSA